jgi:hypothetical protein
MTFPTRFSILLATALAACGGSSASSPTHPPPPPSARVSLGVVTAKAAGTLTLNGAVVAIPATATVRVDGQPRGEAEIHRGEIARVSGDLRDRSGTAAEIEIRSQIRGRVRSSSASAASATLDVGGRTVHVEDSTHLLDDSGVDIAFSDLQPDDRVSITGFPDDQGRLRASSVQRTARGSSDDGLQLRGFVSGLASTAGTSTFTLSPSLPAPASGNLNVSVPSSAVGAGVQDGSFVEVQAAAGATGSDLAATRVTLDDDDLGPESTEVEVEGIVTSGTAAAFAIGGQQVATGASTRWEFGTSADFAVGSRLEAEGVLDASNVLVATKISFKANARIQAPVTALTATSLTALGIPVALDELTRIEDPLADGSVYEVRGIVRRDASGAAIGLRATRIRARSSGGGGSGGGGNASFLQGPVDQVTGTTSLSILGVGITTASATFLAHKQSDSAAEVPMTRDAFFAALVPGSSVVKARLAAAPIGGTAAGDELEVEDEPGSHP